MEPDGKGYEGKAMDAMGVDTQTTNPTSPPDEVWASKVITTYLLAQSEEYRKLSELRQKVSLNNSPHP